MYMGILYFASLPLLLKRTRSIICFDKVFNSLLFCLTAHNKIWIYDQLKVCLFACKRANFWLYRKPFPIVENVMDRSCKLKGILPISSIQNNKFNKNRLFKCALSVRAIAFVIAIIVQFRVAYSEGYSLKIIFFVTKIGIVLIVIVIEIVCNLSEQFSLENHQFPFDVFICKF